MLGLGESDRDPGSQAEAPHDQPHPGEERRKMSEIDDTPRTYSGALLAAIALALLCAVGGLIWTYTLSGRIAHEEAALADANQQNVKLAAELRETDARLKVTADEWANPWG